MADSEKTSGENARCPGKTGRGMGILFEAAVVAAVGLVLAFVANAVSPRGLDLGMDYFPTALANTGVPANPQHQTAAVDTTSPGAVEDPKLVKVAARLKAKGLQMIRFDAVIALHQDPRYLQEMVVFLDARNDEHYQEGHIPGAYQFDHYRAANFFPEIIPVCQAAEQIVVYCNGGECEDSEFAAITLQRMGIPKEKLFVYGGGIAEWIKRGQQVEKGARHSGVLEVVKP
jgi:rhodanese-related sulfurtransferase